jgi:hypothetical protein
MVLFSRANKTTLVRFEISILIFLQDTEIILQFI